MSTFPETGGDRTTLQAAWRRFPKDPSGVPPPGPPAPLTRRRRRLLGAAAGAAGAAHGGAGGLCSRSWRVGSERTEPTGGPGDGALNPPPALSPSHRRRRPCPRGGFVRSVRMPQGVSGSRREGTAGPCAPGLNSPRWHGLEETSQPRCPPSLHTRPAAGCTPGTGTDRPPKSQQLKGKKEPLFCRVLWVQYPPVTSLPSA